MKLKLSKTAKAGALQISRIQRCGSLKKISEISEDAITKRMDRDVLLSEMKDIPA